MNREPKTPKKFSPQTKNFQGKAITRSQSKTVPGLVFSKPTGSVRAHIASHPVSAPQTINANHRQRPRQLVPHRRYITMHVSKHNPLPVTTMQARD